MLRQFSDLKTLFIAKFVEFFFFFFSHFFQESTDMSMSFFSVHLLLLVLVRLVILVPLWTFFSKVSSSWAYETFSFFHKVVSFGNRERVDVHCIRCSLWSREVKSSSAGRIVLLCSCSFSFPSNDTIHLLPLMMKFDGPFVPINQSLWWILQSKDSSL